MLGANGAGKSTLLLALAGLLPLAEGRVLWEGRPVSGRKSHSFLRDNVGLLLQDPEDQLFAPTVEQDVAFGLVQRGMPDADALRLARGTLESLGIAHLAGRAVHHLSLGEKKRVALGGLLVLEPRLLLLDEPTAGLDRRGTRALLGSLERLCANGMTVVMATHDTSLAAQWAARAAVLHDGELLVHGPVQATLTDRQSLRLAGLEPPLTYTLAEALRGRLGLEQRLPLPATVEELEQFLHNSASQGSGFPPRSRGG